MAIGASASWGDPQVTSWFGTHGCSDPGEAAALGSLGTWRSGRVLDVGVGGGRTTGLLARRAASYLGIDVEPAMVALARQQHPQADLRIADARELEALSGLPETGFDLVVWSFNGLDALGHADRLAVLASLARLTAPTGRVLFSSLNLDGVSYDERPWRLPRPTGRRARRQLAVLARHPALLPRSIVNYRHTRRRSEDGDGWGMRPMRAHEFRFLVHFATLAETVAEARSAGLLVEAAWSETGAPVDPAARHCDADYVHYVCRPAV